MFLTWIDLKSILADCRTMLNFAVSRSAVFVATNFLWTFLNHITLFVMSSACYKKDWASFLIFGLKVLNSTFMTFGELVLCRFVPDFSDWRAKKRSFDRFWRLARIVLDFWLLLTQKWKKNLPRSGIPSQAPKLWLRISSLAIHKRPRISAWRLWFAESKMK